MLNLKLLIDFSHEFIMEKEPETIHEGIHKVLSEASEKFLAIIRLEYESIFKYVKVRKNEKKILEEICKQLTVFNQRIDSILSRKAKKRKDIFDSSMMDDKDEEYNKTPIQNTESLIYNLEMLFNDYKKSCFIREKKYVKRAYEDKNTSNSLGSIMFDDDEEKDKKYKYLKSLAQNTKIKGKDSIKTVKRVKKRSWSQDSVSSTSEPKCSLGLRFCEFITNNFNKLFLKCNYTTRKVLEESGNSELGQVVEKYLDDVLNHEVFFYIKKRVMITQKSISLLEQIRKKNFDTYTDKLLILQYDKNAFIKNSSSCENCQIYNKECDFNRLSNYLSKIKSLTFSNGNTSLVEEIHYVLCKRSKNRLSNEGYHCLAKKRIAKGNSSTYPKEKREIKTVLAKRGVDSEMFSRSSYYCHIF